MGSRALYCWFIYPEDVLFWTWTVDLVSHWSIGILLSRRCASLGNFCLEVIVKKLDLIWSVERSDISSVLVSSVCQSTTIRNFQVFSSYVPKNNKHVNRQRISGKCVELILRMNHPTCSMARTPLFVHTCSFRNEWAVSTKQITKNPINKEFASQLLLRENCLVLILLFTVWEKII